MLMILLACFGCCVAKVLCSYLSDTFHIDFGNDYEPIARWCVSNNKYKVMNRFSAALMWCLWKFNNEMCLDCLATKLFGAAGVQLQSHAKQALNNEMCFQGKMWMEKAALEKIDQHNKELARAVCG